jgi:hypothetical protein
MVERISLRNCHLFLGGAGLLLFILTGQYMARIVGVPELADTDRMLYRSVHIYLLLACTANVVAGHYQAPGVRLDRLQQLSSALLLLSPLLLAWSFFTEPASGSLDRPVAEAGLYLIFAATALLLVADGYRRIK